MAPLSPAFHACASCWYKRSLLLLHLFMHHVCSPSPHHAAGYFTSPSKYLAWRRSHPPSLPSDAPVVAVLLYRKHIVTEQAYVPRLIRMMEEGGLLPLPIFINGVEAHTVVRDLLTTAHEQVGREGGR